MAVVEEVEVKVEEVEEISPAIVALQEQVSDLDIWDNEQRDEAMRMLKVVAKTKRDLKKDMDSALKPFKEGIDNLKSRYKPHMDELTSLDKKIRDVIAEYDTEVAKEHEKENARKKAEFDAKQKAEAEERAKAFVKAKEKGEDTTELVKEMMVKEKFVPEGVAEEVDGVTSKAVKVWNVYLLDGSKWDKKKRLPLMDVVSPLPLPDYAFMQVDSKAINQMFSKGIGLPEWVKIEDSRKIIAR